MNGKKWWEALPQSFDACIPGVWVMGFGAVTLNPVIMAVGFPLIVIPAAIVVIRRVAGG